MKFVDKLERLIREKGLGQTDVAEKAGISPTAMSNYLNRGSTPGVDSALRLARALGCSLEWLVDDSMDWDAPPSAKEIPDSVLASELAARYLAAAVRMRSDLEKSKSIDWPSVAMALAVAPADGTIPSEIQPAIALFNSIMQARFMLLRFDIVRNPHSFAPSPSREFRADELSQSRLFGELSRQFESLPGLSAVGSIVNYREVIPNEGQYLPEAVALVKKKFAAEMDKLHKPSAANESPGKGGPKAPPKQK
jgi:transcriptional regulator with XRE-family HTH domain